VAACETCSAPVQRVFHPVAVHFKGSGFYNTDYGKRKRGEASGTEKKTETKSESKSESKSGGDSSSKD
jgi:predicted nucleic acid-binding Zn ribbon protein